MTYVLLVLLCMAACAIFYAASLVFFPASLGIGRSFVFTFLLSVFILAKLKGSLRSRDSLICAAISLCIGVLVPLCYVLAAFWSVNYSGPTIFGVPAPLTLPILVPALGSAFVWFCFYSEADPEPKEQ